MPLHKFNNPGLVYYQALSKYLELVQEISEVVEVRLSEDDELYAILSATPHDDAPCYRVYQAEGKVMDSVEDQPYRFRLVNAQELPEEGRGEHIGNLGDLVWKGQGVPETTESEEGILATSKLNNPGLIYYQALSKYLELVKEIPEVVEVRLSGDDVVCTIISADYMDKGPRYRVFEAQTAVIRAVANQPFDFRLLNRQSLTAKNLDEHISGYGDLVWER